MLREIRTANRKLKRLEDIKQQLKSLGVSVEEINARLDKLNALGESVSNNDRAGSGLPPLNSRPSFGMNPGQFPPLNTTPEQPMNERSDIPTNLTRR